ncbi:MULTISPECIES: HTH-type transcriptional regulator MalT [Vibrio]|jgi:LuxR family maltose regulon positive regulatory protein|uniref:HTH-type transcriptional regulator MalT n=1 Tax=Vibrio harveyi TaxID=669 RepID=K5U1W8_VIBHA|nr:MULTISPECIES: HTH-type transcriptional regulator MalT [Vibrio]AMF99687.1 HTH-type transcriptional regulator MalT [Vibrio harveyi]AWB02884.1 HTH-type transcriptional regulator MalT [Vibrio harveyi]EKM14884.1 HTH-type transcriptional regulator malT [Vibrio harveyi]EKM32862.1 HTH-type transcriptional regulator malT [Vibrio harveyi]EKO3784401.1 HTH-type transcriptional regulator MalT [Vibrio harveyi]
MWIPSKLTRPGRLHNAIVRPRVLDLLQQAPYYKLVLFRSPAGYGKTTMAAQWLSDKPNVGWYSIDDSDNDGFRFVNYLLQALNKATNYNCSNAQKLAEKRQFSSLRSLFSEVFAEMADFQHECYVVLDDYHLITNDEIHESMRFFLKHMPDNLTVVVTSRAAPPLGTANLRVRDLMIEIGNEMLAFDTEETTRFFNQRIADGIDEDMANNLRTYVEGWPSALQLIALQAQHQNRTLAQTVESVSQFNHAHLWDYLVEEVFDLLDKETRHFLMQVSVLDHFNDELVFALTQREDALGMIESLNRYGLFIYPLEGEQNWFRFHNLFGEFLSHERQARIPQQEKDLHRNAAVAWLKQKAPHQAIHHAQKSDDTDLIVEILNEFGWKMFNQGELTTLEAAINQLDKDLLFSHPKLSMLRAWLAQSQHRYNQVGELLAEAEEEHKKRNIELDSGYQGQANALLAQVAINSNQPERALELAELALSQLDPTVYRSRIVATSVVGEVNHVLGKLDRALPMMQQTEKLARQYQVYHQALWAILQQSEIMIAQGYVQAAFELQDSGFRLIEDQQLQHVPLHEFLLRIRAQVLWCWNRLDEAEECSYKGLQILENHSPSKHLHSYSMLARIAIGRGELDKAGKFIEHIQHLMKQSTYHVDWTANASLSLILFWQARGNTEAIQEWLNTAVRPESACNHFLQLQWRNIARAHINLGQYDEARQALDFLQSEARRTNLVTDTNRNLVVEAVFAARQKDEEQAKALLKEALVMTNQTGMVGNFLIDGATIGGLLEKLSLRHELGDLERHRAQQLMKDISSNQRSRSIHFDEDFIEKLVNHPNVPELVRTSPLTQREWQVLGLIYSGFSNEQIAQELDVAGTTIKTHIRNLYQKLNIANRKEAIVTAENLLQLMGY